MANETNPCTMLQTAIATVSTFAGTIKPWSIPSWMIIFKASKAWSRLDQPSPIQVQAVHGCVLDKHQIHQYLCGFSRPNWRYFFPIWCEPVDGMIDQRQTNIRDEHLFENLIRSNGKGFHFYP
jgi:hypothetical protein